MYSRWSTHQTITIVHKACQSRERQLLSLLLQHSADTNAVYTRVFGFAGRYADASKIASLHMACGSSDLQVVEMLLQHGADANALKIMSNGYSYNVWWTGVRRAHSALHGMPKG